MIDKIRSSSLNIIFILIMIFTTYIIWAFYDLTRLVHITSISHIEVSDKNGKIEMSEDWTTSKSINVSYGDVIILKFSIEQFRHGTASLERIIRYADGDEIIVFYAQRPHVGPRKYTLLSQYKIEVPIKEGCGHLIYLRISFRDNYNVLTKFFPINVQTDKIPICLVKS